MFLVLLLAFAALGNAQLIVRTVCGPGSPISGNSAVSSGESINLETGASYTYLNSDCGKLVTHSNGGAISGTLPQANSATFRSGWFMDVQNIGVGTLTVTPTTSTIDGAATLVFTTGQGARIVSNGADYSTQRGGAGSVISGGTVTSVGFSATPGTVTGSPITTSGTINYSFTGANVVSLFTGCSGTLYLGADGACHSPGTGTVTSVGFTGGLISVATATTTPAFTVAGTSGGIPYFSAASTWASSGVLGANLPLFGGGAGASPIAGTRSGNTTQVVTTTGAQTSGDCVKIDANGNHIANGSACGSGTGDASISAIQANTYLYVADTSASTTAYTGCPTPSVTASTGMVLYFVPANSNTAASTFNLCGGGAVSITANNTTHSALVADDLLASGVYTFEYDGARWLKINGPDTAWVGVSFANSWANNGVGFQNPQYKKYNNGDVQIRGLAACGTTTAATNTMTLPVGYRPTATDYWLLATDAAVAKRFDVGTAGTVAYTTGGACAFIDFSAIRFSVY